MAERQVLAVTAGDPRGIGPEIIIKALADPRVRERCDVLVVGPSGIGLDVAADIGKWKAGGSAPFLPHPVSD